MKLKPPQAKIIAEALQLRAQKSFEGCNFLNTHALIKAADEQVAVAEAFKTLAQVIKNYKQPKPVFTFNLFKWRISIFKTTPNMGGKKSWPIRSFSFIKQ